MDPSLQIVEVEVVPIPEAVAWQQQRPQPLQLHVPLRNWPPLTPPDVEPLDVVFEVEVLLEEMTTLGFRPDLRQRRLRISRVEVRVVDCVVVVVVETGGGDGDDDGGDVQMIVQQQLN